MNIQLETENSMSKVILEDSGKLKYDLFYLLSYPDKSKEFAYKRRTGKFKSFRNYLIKQDVEDNRPNVFLFPSGLLETVSSYLGSQGYQYTIKEGRREPSEHRHFRKYGGMPKLRDYQEKIISACMEEPVGIVEAATGTGKSLCMAELIYRREVPTLIIVPSVNILNQFYDTLINVFTEREVGIIGGGKDQNKKHIVIATYQSLLDKPKDIFKKFGMVLIDEAHHSAAETIQEINETCLKNVYYRYYFTATPFRSDGADIALAGVVGTKKLYVYNFKQACADGWLTPPKFIMCNFDHKCAGKFDDYTEEYKELISDNERFNEKIKEMVDKLISKGRHVLIFVKHIEHGQRLQRMINDSILLTGLESPKDSQKIIKDFENKKFSVLIGTSVIGEGVDLKSVDCGIMACAGRSRGDVMQKVGRLLRKHEGKKDCIIIDYTHDGSTYNKRHALERRKIYESYGQGITEIE